MRNFSLDTSLSNYGFSECRGQPIFICHHENAGDAIAGFVNGRAKKSAALLALRIFC